MVNQIKTRTPVILLWIFSLAVLAVGARNFEEGMSLDGPVYANVARNMARGGSLFRMDASIPDFVPFAEHPHLGFWLESLVFRVLPAQDWSARMLGHLWYVVFLLMLFFYVRKKSSEKVAVVAITLLWTFHIFSNTFSTFYLDPGVLVLGTAALLLFERALETYGNKTAIVAGGLLGLAAMYKGLTILGFLPAAFFMVLVLRNKKAGWAGISFAIGLMVTLAGYFLLIKSSDCPEFLNTYWSRQVSHRFAQQATLANLFRAEFWWQLLNYSNYLLPLTLLTLRGIKRRAHLHWPWILALSFIGQFGMSGLSGGQYLIMILPWIAWLVSEVVAPWIPGSSRGMIRFTQAISLLGFFILQYAPIRTHGKGPHTEWLKVHDWSRGKIAPKVYLDDVMWKSSFIGAASFAWYGDVHILYPDRKNLPPAEPNTAFYTSIGGTDLESGLQQTGWCPVPEFPGRLFLTCDR